MDKAEREKLREELLDWPISDRAKRKICLVLDHIDALERQVERFNKFEEWAEKGNCPALLNDDNGHWAVSFDGIQDCQPTEEAESIQTDFWVEKDQWKDSVEEAIDAAVAMIAEEAAIDSAQEPKQ